MTGMRPTMRPTLANGGSLTQAGRGQVTRLPSPPSTSAADCGRSSGVRRSARPSSGTGRTPCGRPAGRPPGPGASPGARRGEPAASGPTGPPGPGPGGVRRGSRPSGRGGRRGRRRGAAGPSAGRAGTPRAASRADGSAAARRCPTRSGVPGGAGGAPGWCPVGAAPGAVPGARSGAGGRTAGGGRAVPGAPEKTCSSAACTIVPRSDAVVQSVSLSGSSSCSPAKSGRAGALVVQGHQADGGGLGVGDVEVAHGQRRGHRARLDAGNASGGRGVEARPGRVGGRAAASCTPRARTGAAR